MISSVLLSAAVFMGMIDGDGAATSPSVQGVYTSAATRARRDPDAHVRLALWCEAHGMTAERLKHLSLAVLYDPSHALARADGAGRLSREMGTTRRHWPANSE